MPDAPAPSLPSAAPFAGRAALAAALGLGAVLAAWPVDAPGRGWGLLVPTVAMMTGGLWWMRRVRDAAAQGLRLDRLLRGWTGICLATGFAAGLLIVLWYARIRPEMLETWLAAQEAGLVAQGYSPGDTDEILHRLRVTLTGPLGVFLGTVLWTLSGLVPGLVLSLLQLRELSGRNA